MRTLSLAVFLPLALAHENLLRAALRAEHVALSAIATTVEQATLATTAAEQAHPTPPQIPVQWSASASVITMQHGHSISPFVGVTYISSNLTSKRQLLQTGYKLPYAPSAFEGTPKEWLNTTQISDGTFSGELLEGAKYVDPQRHGFQDLFGWVRGAKYAGEVTVNGTALQKWTISGGPPIAPYPFSFSLLADGDTPVRMGQNLTYPGYGAINVTFAFYTFTPNDEPTWAKDLWAGFRQADYTTPPVCPLPHDGKVPAAREQEVNRPPPHLRSACASALYFDPSGQVAS